MHFNPPPLLWVVNTTIEGDDFFNTDDNKTHPLLATAAGKLTRDKVDIHGARASTTAHQEYAKSARGIWDMRASLRGESTSRLKSAHGLFAAGMISKVISRIQ